MSHRALLLYLLQLFQSIIVLLVSFLFSNPPFPSPILLPLFPASTYISLPLFPFLFLLSFLCTTLLILLSVYLVLSPFPPSFPPSLLVLLIMCCSSSPLSYPSPRFVFNPLSLAPFLISVDKVLMSYRPACWKHDPKISEQDCLWSLVELDRMVTGRNVSVWTSHDVPAVFWLAG